MKRVWNNISKGKKIAGLVTLCLAVMLGYFGYHRLTAHADEKISRGVVNDLSQLPTDMSAQNGSAEHPFMVLEIVPYCGQAEFGYLLEGCEPYNVTSDSKYLSALYNNGVTAGSAVTMVFDDEESTLPSKYRDDWEKKTGSMKAAGYYEMVGPNRGNFKLTGTTYAYDNPNQVYPTKLETVYRPNFERVAEGAGDWIWVTIGTSGYDIKAFITQENKFSKKAETEIDYEVGDREYTIRDSSLESNPYYYALNSMHGELGRKYVHFDLFLRTALGIRTREDIENFHVVIKTIEPKELAENPEWIDYADLIYMSQGGTSSGVPDKFWNKEEYESIRILRDTGTGTIKSVYNSSNDFSWEVAKKLFFKVNGLDIYDGDGDFNIAPMIMNRTILDNSIGRVFNDTNKSTLTHYSLDYTTLDAMKQKKNDQGSTINLADTSTSNNSNMYKFLLMNFLMKQDNFYQYFFVNERTNAGGTVIQADSSNKIGLCTPQDSGEPQEYWNPICFLPEPDFQNSWTKGYTKEQLDLYGVKYKGMYSSGTFFNSGWMDYSEESNALNGATFVYNGDNIMTQFFGSTNLNSSNKWLSDAFDWYTDEYELDEGALKGISPVQMVQYLLNYKKDGGGYPPNPGNRTKETLKVLEVEPCNSFTLTQTYLLAKLPKSRFDGNIEIDYMTTQEFNGSKKDISGEYDLVYLGLNADKLNQNAQGSETIYNDSVQKNKVYLHVGDLIQQASGKELRFSGNDISTLKRAQLYDYVIGGNGLVLADDLSIPSAAVYKNKVDQSANISKLVKNVVQVDENIEKHVTALKSLDYVFLSNYCINFTGSKLSITENPLEYVSGNSNGSFSDGDDSSSSSVNATLNGSTLDFSFTIGKSSESPNEKYGVKIFMDIDYDGVISDNDNKKEIVYDSYNINSKTGVSYSYEAEEITDASGKKVTQLTPQNVSFDFNRYYTNRKQPVRRNGAVSWKFVIYSIDNPEYYVSKTGTSWYNSATTGQTEINIYQIVKDADDDTAVDLQKQLEDTSSLFYQYAHDLSNYKITVTTETLSEYLAKFTGAANSEVEKEALASQFSNYNVFLISCGTDLQKADDTNGAVSFITSEAESGVSALYTGDAVSNTNSASSDMTQRIKNLLNQSRFTEQDTSYKDNPTYTKADNSTDKYNLDDYDSLEYSYMAGMKSGTTSNSYLCYKNDIWKQVNEQTSMKYGTAAQKATKITRLNRGTISTYPYTITEEVKVSGTAAQDYQLNMNNPELTVWYCLSGADDSMYGISPNDATNNYYLYSVSNVTYTGIDLKNTSSDMEMKLFINTLIGNYEIGYRHPHVAIDEIKGIGEKNDGSVQDSSNMNSTESNKYFDGYMSKIKLTKKYTDYEKGSDSNETLTTEEPSRSIPPEATDEPEITNTPTPVSTASPVPTPVTLYDSAGSTTTIPWNGVTVENAAAFEGLDNEAVIQIRYYGSNQWVGSPAFVIKNASDAQKDITVNACQGTSANPSETQTYNIKVSDFKAYFSMNEDSDIQFIGLYNGNWGTTIESIKIYANMELAEKSADSSSDVGSDATDDMDTTLQSEYEEVDNDNYIPANRTHKIFFTPYDNNVAGGNIRSLRISLTNNNNGSETEHSLVKKIYQKYEDETGTHIFMYRASDDGSFTIANSNFVKDSKQYFFLYDEAFVLSEYHFVKFEITNRKKSGVTYLDMTLNNASQADNTYVFPLD